MKASIAQVLGEKRPMQLSIKNGPEGLSGQSALAFVVFCWLVYFCKAIGQQCIFISKSLRL
jgi:hypothetical protein